MTPLDVARYLRAFQKAATTRKIKSRMIRRDSRYDDNLAELIRAVLPKTYVRMIRRRRGYELHWHGTEEQAGRLHPILTRLAPTMAGLAPFLELVGTARYHWQPTQWIGQPTEELLDTVVALQPVMARFKRDEARIAAGEVVAAPPEERPLNVVDPNSTNVEELETADEFLEENEEEVNVEQRVVIVEEVRRTATPQNLEEQFAAAARARMDGLAPAGQPPAFATEGARRFAEMLARANANRGRQ